MLVQKILVIGKGFLGGNLLSELEKNSFSVSGLHYQTKDNRIKIDVTKAESVEKNVSRINPEVIINCAANVNVDFLEKNPDLASVNSDGAKNVAKIAQKWKIKLIHISTDGVFDGKRGLYAEEDVPNPINVYGKSKLLGEKYVEENSDKYVIVRTNFYGYDKNGKFLLNYILNSLKNHKEISGFADVIFTPLEVSNLSNMIIELINSKYQGIIHLSSNDIISKFEFARKVADTFGFDKKLVKKGSVDDIKFIAKRPKNTSLSNLRAKQLLNTRIMTLQESLDKIKKSL